MHLPEIDYSKFTLDNGLDVLLRYQPGLPLVATNLWYHVGSKNEERSQRGYAHLFEHLMFEGSAHFPGDFFKRLQPLGANINGSTSSDRTNYFVDIPAAHLELVLAMESDRMAFLVPALDDSKLNIQKGVVKNEYRQNYANRPYGMVWPVLSEALYPPHHPYSWLTIGDMEDLEAASLGDVSAFFQRYYVPANTSLAIVGDIDPERTLTLVERYFGSIGSGSKPLLPWTPDPAFGGSREIVLQDRVELNRYYLVWHSVPHFHAADAALSVLGDILARGRASRLYQHLVVDRQIAQDISAYQSGRELAGTFGIIATLRPLRSIDELRDHLDAEIGRIASEGVSETELQRVLTMRTASLVFALEHMGGFGGVADRLNAYNVFRGDPSLVTSDLERYLSLTPEAIREVAAGYVAGKPRVGLSVLGRKPASSSVPLDRKIPPASKPPAVYHAPRPEMRTLGNGTPLWVLPRRDLPAVALAITLPGGSSLQPPARAGVAQLAVAMLDEGTASRSAAEIALAAEAMGTALSASCGWDGAFVTARFLKAFLEPSLALAVEILRHPTFPEAEWNRIHAQTLAALRSQRDHAESRAHRELLRSLYGPEHPYGHPLDGAESIVAGLSRAEAIAFHGRHLGPSGAAVVIAGDVDPDEVARILDAHLAGWEGPPPNGP